MALSITYIWLIAGVLMLAAEALGATGVGLMFAGLGAITTGAFLNMQWIAEDAHLIQFLVFLAATAIWTVLLWKPMRRFYSSNNAQGYQNMVGDTAYVGSNGLTKGHVGEATWSGTIMKAELAHGTQTDRLEAGTQVVITEVKGATLIVKPK